MGHPARRENPYDRPREGYASHLTGFGGERGLRINIGERYVKLVNAAV